MNSFTLMKIKLTIIAIIVSVCSYAQIAPDKYFIQFTDKNGSSYSVDHPEEFLSQRSISRRIRQSIPVTENDIPVVAAYLEGVENIGVQLLNPTKWLNGITIYTDDADKIQKINELPYVEKTLKLTDDISRKLVDDKFHVETGFVEKSTSALDYGYSYGQINQLSGIPLHEENFEGQDILIAVLDAGFTGVQEHPVFGYLWETNRIIATKDFVWPGGDVFDGHSHGEMVLSCMGANLPEEMIGTAPEASYLLLRSEDGTSENIIEEYNWVSAAEYADSAGADIINSSLSYTTFDMPQWSHTHADMNGHTAPASIGASYATHVGIFVCASAGNSVGVTWVGSPGDADSVCTVGAVTLSGDRASFSSVGPTADGRTVPVVMACGQGATVATGTSSINLYGNGTSFSSPILAGMVACLWQKHYNLSMMTIQNTIKQSGNNASNPNDLIGWGIPNFTIADSILTALQPKTNGIIAKAGPNPTRDNYTINIIDNTVAELSIKIYSYNGQLILDNSYKLGTSKKITLDSEVEKLNAGYYFLKISSNNNNQTISLIKQ